MMNKAIIYSVPSTGTRFCKKFLEDVLDYKQIRTSELKNDVLNVYCQIHSSKINFDRVMSFYSNIKLVVPLRDPYLSVITRYLMSDNAAKYIETTGKENWKNLIKMTSRYPAVFVPVNCDESDRVNILQSVVHHLDATVENELLLEYANEWPIVDSKGISKVKQEYLDQGTIDGTKPTFLDFAVEWQDQLLNTLSK